MRKTIGQIHLPLTYGPSVNCVLKNLFVFHFNSTKIGEVVAIYVYKNFTKFHWIQMKNKSFFDEAFNGRFVP